jgi:hypothetical protein
MTKEFIIESKKYGNYTVLVDEEDWSKIRNYTWRLFYDTRHDCITSVRTNVLREPRERRALAYRDGPNRPPTRRGFKEKQIKIHNVILDHDPDKSDLIVDHINGNVLDNRRCNLRLCTRAENARNVKKSKSNTSGYVGVHASGKKWRATVALNGKNYCAGSFEDKVEAARARDRKAIELHGEFARLNFPREEYEQWEA